MRAKVCFLIVGLFLAGTCGCSAPMSRSELPRKTAAAPWRGDVPPPEGNHRPIESAPEPRTPLAGKPSEPAPAGRADLANPDVGKPPDRAPAAAEALAGADKAPRAPKSRDAQEPQSGILTAGSFDDNLDPQLFHSFVGKMAQHRELGDLPGRFLGQRLLVSVKDAAGNPVGNAGVHVAAPGGPSVDLTSRTDGRVVFLSSWDQVAADRELEVTVTPPDGSGSVKQKVPPGTPRWEVTLPAFQAQPPRDLDLTILLDTTGSMRDELEYLKAEIKGIATAVHDKFPQVNQRYGLVLYRDDGDEYVTRRFDFTTSVDEFRKNLAAQSAAGGGDYPEAMHRGMEEAVQLRWREGNTARVMFLIADAPPHAQFMGRTLNAANALRKKGVSIYPVACSGYDDAAEFVMRGCALLTGSRFLFLTNDSGVGDGHAEPSTAPSYHVERLDRLMIEVIAGELTGKRIDPEPAGVLRTVGKPIN
jgi:hypothetical protein